MSGDLLKVRLLWGPVDGATAPVQPATRRIYTRGTFGAWTSLEAVPELEFPIHSYSRIFGSEDFCHEGVIREIGHPLPYLLELMTGYEN